MTLFDDQHGRVRLMIEKLVIALTLISLTVIVVLLFFWNGLLVR